MDEGSNDEPNPFSRRENLGTDPTQNPYVQEPDAANDGRPAGSKLENSTAPVLNPYAPTTHVSDTTGNESDVEAFRRHYLAHEASVKSLGILYFVPGVILVILFSIIFTVSIFDALIEGFDQLDETDIIGFIIGTLFYGGLGCAQIYTGWGLRRFRPNARRLAILFSSLGLIAFPIGTVINGYFLYLLISDKGKVVFSEAYQDAIAQTPHIKYRTSLLVKILIVLVLAFIAIGVLAAVLGV